MRIEGNARAVGGPVGGPVGGIGGEPVRGAHRCFVLEVRSVTPCRDHVK